MRVTVLLIRGTRESAAAVLKVPVTVGLLAATKLDRAAVVDDPADAATFGET